MLKVEVDVSKEVARALQKAKEIGVNLTIPFMLITKSWYKSNRSIFALKSAGKYPILGGLKPLAPAWNNSKMNRNAYAEKRKLEKYGFVYPLMKATGELEASLTDPTNTNAINLIVNNKSLYLGTRVEYAPYHQSPGIRTKLPFRPIVFIGVEQLATTEHRNEYSRIFDIINDSIQQRLDKLAASKP